MDDDDWQEMPVVRDAAGASSSSSDEGDKSGFGRGSRRTKAVKNAYSARQAFKHGRTDSGGYGTIGASGSTSQPGQLSGATNATGRHLNIDDARGYSWRAKPEGLGDAGGMGPAKKESKADRRARRAKRKNATKGQDSASSSSSSDSSGDDSEGGARGYTQIRLDDDPEAEEINAATDYLFTGGGGPRQGGTGLDDVDGVGATPHSQLNTTKNLLSEGQKIAYVGLVSLTAKSLVRQLERVPGKELKAAVSSGDEWRLRVMARIYQHMDIESGEQKMIESLAEHGVLMADLSPSLITTQTVDNPDFDPQALEEREEEERRKQEAGGADPTDGGAASPERTDMADDDADVQTLVSEEKDIGPEKSKGDQQTEVQDKADAEDALSDMDGGDLGGRSSTPPPAYRPKVKVHRPDGEDNDDVAAHDDKEADDADITAAFAANDVKHEIKHDDTTATIVDPNTAARMETMGESLSDGTMKVTAMGLTNQPQTIDTLPSALEGVTTELSSADKTITLDLRWTVLCDLFLVLTADSVYDARSRVLLERTAEELGLTWMDVTKFEKRVTDALEIEEGVSGGLKGKKAVRKRAEMARRRRMVMMGLATVGGGLVIGLSAGLMAPLIGVGLGAALGSMGIGGTSAFLGGVGGAAIITSTGTVAGAALGGTGMGRRTRSVRTFEFKPIHNNKRVNCIIAVPGFMSGPQDDPRLPFSVVDSIMGDIFSLLWEPDMMQEMGNAIYLLWSETLVQGVQQVLAATIAGGLVGALAWPLWLTKLGWFIDNPWSNALDRAHACGLILADVLAKRKMGVRPVTLVGFSLGARVIFYALVELARMKKYGIVQNVYMIGAPVTANDKTWKEARSVVAGRFVNAYSRTDWILGWLFRATTGGLRSIAGLRPVERVPEVENVDVTQTVPGHLQYRAFMPLVLAQLGFRTTAEYFDEPEDMDNIPEREVVYDQPVDEERKLKTVQTKTGGFGRIFKRSTGPSDSGSDANATPSGSNLSRRPSTYEIEDDIDDLPPREAAPPLIATPEADAKVKDAAEEPPDAKSKAQQAMDETERVLAELRENGIEVRELHSSLPTLVARSNPVPPPRRGSKLKESLLPEAEARSDGEGSEMAEDVAQQSYAPVQVAPEVNVSDVDDTSPLPPRESEFVERSVGWQGEDDAPLPSLVHAQRTPVKEYARPFGSTSFDAHGLPPSAPSISHHTDVSLSFGDTYEEGEAGIGQSPAGNAKQSKSSTDYESARTQYGLSADAARELAMQFQSAGMSNAGALAAARMAQKFEASDDLQQPSLDISGGGADPWGALATSSSETTPSYGAALHRARAGRLSDADHDGVLAVPSSTHVSTWNSTSDNPWD